MSPRKLTPIQRLMAAMDRCALTRGEAQWTHGYRTARFALDHAFDMTPDGERLIQKENAQWGRVITAENNFRRLAIKLLREARQSQPSRSSRSSKTGGRNG